MCWKNEEVYIIAEAGVNHNGDLELARSLIDGAKSAGANAVKFQTFMPENLVCKFAPLAQYQKNNTGETKSQLDMLSKLALTFNQFEELASYCRKVNIQFTSTPFDLESIEFLKASDMPFWKIPSGEITNVPYLIKIAKIGKPVIMSTGMCSLDEVDFAVQLLKENGAGEISLLHCNTAYPTPYEDVNLKAMGTLQKRFQCQVGYSDHTEGIEVSLAAVALGAKIIEKHFTLDKTMKGPDHKVSLEPEELKKMVASIRNIEMALGTGIKEPTESELRNRDIARKSIVAKKPINKGEILTDQNLTVKRPGTGISPTKWFEVLGTLAKQNFEEDELIKI